LRDDETNPNVGLVFAIQWEKRYLKNKTVDKQTAKNQTQPEVRSEACNVCSAAPENFGVLSLFGVADCFGHSEIESVIINCNSAWQYPIYRVSNPEPTSYLSRYLANALQYKLKFGLACNLRVKCGMRK
jgi:hypothetical protein